MRNTTIHIPATVEEAVSELTGIEALLTSKGWERAAIVAAFVRVGKRGDNRFTVERTSALYESPRSFAALGIGGLKSDRTVSFYVQRWLDAHDNVYPEPGAEVLIPETEWPPRERNRGSRAPKDTTKAVRDLIERDGVEAVAEAIDVVLPKPAKLRPKPVPGPMSDEDEALMDFRATLGTANGHTTSVKNLFGPVSHILTNSDKSRIRAIAERWSMIADMAEGLGDVNDLSDLFASLEGES